MKLYNRLSTCMLTITACTLINSSPSFAQFGSGAVGTALQGMYDKSKIDAMIEASKSRSSPSPNGSVTPSSGGVVAPSTNAAVAQPLVRGGTVFGLFRMSYPSSWDWLPGMSEFPDFVMLSEKLNSSNLESLWTAPSASIAIRRRFQPEIVHQVPRPNFFAILLAEISDQQLMDEVLYPLSAGDRDFGPGHLGFQAVYQMRNGGIAGITVIVAGDWSYTFSYILGPRQISASQTTVDEILEHIEIVSEK